MPAGDLWSSQARLGPPAVPLQLRSRRSVGFKLGVLVGLTLSRSTQFCLFQKGIGAAGNGLVQYMNVQETSVLNWVLVRYRYEGALSAWQYASLTLKWGLADKDVRAADPRNVLYVKHGIETSERDRA